MRDDGVIHIISRMLPLRATLVQTRYLHRLISEVHSHKANNAYRITDTVAEMNSCVTKPDSCEGSGQPEMEVEFGLG